MHTYSGKIRLNGNVYHEVPKAGMTAAEVILLQHIHGSDSIVNMVHEGEVKVRDAVERDRLAQTYGEAKVKEVFGISSLPLPQELAGVEDDEDEPEEPVKRRPRRQAEASAPLATAADPLA